MSKTLKQLERALAEWLYGDEDEASVVVDTSPDPRIREESHKIANNATAIKGALMRLAEYDDPLKELVRRITTEDHP